MRRSRHGAGRWLPSGGRRARIPRASRDPAAILRPVGATIGPETPDRGGRHVRFRPRPRPRRRRWTTPNVRGRSGRRRSCCSRARRGRASPRPCSGASSAATSLFPYPELPAGRAGRGRRGGRGRPRVRRRRTSTPPRSTARPTSPASVIEGLAELGVLGMTAPAEFGGRGFSQSGYCRIMEVIGGHCSSTAVFVNAHHSIGIRALLLFGTPEQKARWLPAAGPRREARGLRADRDRGRLRRQQRPDDGHARATTARPIVLNGTQAVHHQRRDRRRPDRDGPHARPEGGRVEGHGLPGHARHAGLRGRRGPDGRSAASAGRRRPGSPSTTCRCPADERPRPARQGAEGRPDGPRLRPDDLRRELHGAGQDLPRRRRPATPPAAASSAGRWPTSS